MIAGRPPTARNTTATDPAATDSGARPLPFVLRVAAEWMSIDDAPRDDDGQYLYRLRALLTGDVTLTSAGGDVSFTDVGVRP